MKTKKVSLSTIKVNPNNPRLIKDDKFKKLVQSVKDFPQMLEIRPIVVNSDMVILGGNMRFKACQEAGIKELPIIIADNLTEEQQREFLIKDNVSGGEWDWDMLANEWDLAQLEDWGLDVLNKDKELDDNYTSKVDSPIYEIKEGKPSVNELFDTTIYDNLIEEIEKAEIQEEDKEFLRYAAKRHIVFNYAKIAEYYAHSSKEVQGLIENSALVIIDYEKAIEKGFVKLHETLFELSEIDG